MKPDHLDRLAVRLEPGRGGSGVLRRDTQEWRPCFRAGELRRCRDREHEPAIPKSQVDQLVMRAGRLPEHVLANDAKVGCSVVDVCRDIGGADEDHAYRRPIDEQLASQLGPAQPRHTGTAKDLQRAWQQRTGRERDRDPLLLHAGEPARRPATCSGGSFSIRRPGADHDVEVEVWQWMRLTAPTTRHQSTASL